MVTKNIWVIGIAALIVTAALFAYMHAAKTSPIISEEETSMMPMEGAEGNAVVGASGESSVISYTNTGFSPNTITITEGTTVTWINNSSDRMWIAHSAHDGTSESQHCVDGAPKSAQIFDQCSAVPQGGSYSFTFTQIGTSKFYNHEQVSDQGMITVIAQSSASPSVGNATDIRTDIVPN